MVVTCDNCDRYTRRPSSPWPWRSQGSQTTCGWCGKPPVRWPTCISAGGCSHRSYPCFLSDWRFLTGFSSFHLLTLIVPLHLEFFNVINLIPRCFYSPQSLLMMYYYFSQLSPVAGRNKQNFSELAALQEQRSRLALLSSSRNVSRSLNLICK